MSADVVVGIDDDHRCALVARHDGGRQSGGSRPDDHDIRNAAKLNLATPGLCGLSG
jgi:hypothetical protein